MARRVAYIASTDQYRLLFSRALSQVGYDELVFCRDLEAALESLADHPGDSLLLIHGQVPGITVDDGLIHEIRIETSASIIFLGFPTDVFQEEHEKVLVVGPPVTVARLAETAAGLRHVPHTELVRKLIRTQTFEAFSTDAVAFLLSRAKARQLQPGEVLFDRGDPGDSMYIVIVGSVAISIGGRVLESVGPGGVFGEMAMLEGGSRSAKGAAEGLTVLLEIDQRAVEEGATPFRAILFELLTRTLIRRLRAADTTIVELQGDGPG